MSSLLALDPRRVLWCVTPLFVLSAVLSAQEAVYVVVDSLPAMSYGTTGSRCRDSRACVLDGYGRIGVVLHRLYGDGVTRTTIWAQSNGDLSPAARSALAALERLGERGLDPAEFDIPRLHALATRTLRSTNERFEFDVLLSVTVMKVLRALHGAPSEPADSGLARGGASGYEDYAAELEAMATSLNSERVLDAAEPSSEQYRLLRRALGRYRVRALTDSTASPRIDRILGTMARQRVQRVGGEASAVVVNLPAFRLSATGATDLADTLGMNVVVGLASQHATPEMSDSIRYIVFAPYWEVPTSIMRAELLPIARRDPYLLTMNGYQIVDHRGRVMPASAASVKRLAAGNARIRQLPGGTNSLGRVKFMFPNADDVYLHDTPHSKDFARSRRDQSHGCIRVADPIALAQFLLRRQPEWTRERIDRAIRGRVPVTVTLTRPVPIYLTYATAVARSDGGVDFFDDIYRLDTSAVRQLIREEVGWRRQ